MTVLHHLLRQTLPHFIIIMGLFFIMGSGCGGSSKSDNETTNSSALSADKTPPVITITGENPVNMTKGMTYADVGATALDDKDGKITVSSSGGVDTTAIGSYAITYTATDSAGNKSTATRNVVVKAKQKQLKISFFGAGSVRAVGDDNAIQCAANRICWGSFEEGKTITLEAKEEPNSTFDNWQYCDKVENNQCTITMSAEKLVSATFKSTESLAMYDNVIVLSEAQIRAISDFSHTSGVLVLKANTPIDNFKVGNIIISKGIYLGEGNANNVDIYFSRRIKKVVALTGSSIFIDTSEASMADFIREGDLSYQTEIEQSQLPTQLPEGVTLRNAKNLSAKIIPLQLDVLLYDADGNETTTDDQIKAKGTVDFSLRPDFDFNFSIMKGGLTEFRALLESSSRSNLQLNVGGAVQLIKQEIPLLKRSIRLTPVVVGPVVFIPKLNLTLDFEIGVSGKIEAVLDVSSKAITGVHYVKDQGWQNIASYDFDAKPTLDTKLKALVQAGPRLTLSALVYGVVGPEIGVHSFAGFETFAVVPPQDNCRWDYVAFVGGQATFKGVLRLLGKELSYEALLFDVKDILEQYATGCSIDTKPPSAPSDLRISNLTVNSLTLNWTPATDNIGIKSYQVYRNNALIAANNVNAFYLDSRLTANTEYCYHLVAIDTSGNTSAPSETVCATTKQKDITPPNAPENVQATPQSTTAIKVTWDEAFDNVGVDAYIVLDNTQADPNTPAFIVQRTNETSAIVTGLTPETEYCYIVSALDTTGNISLPSSEVCATTLKPEQSRFTIKLACQNQPYIIEQLIDLDEDIVSSVSVTGKGIDYTGIGLAYALSGFYNDDSATLKAEIIWTSEQGGARRRDVFTANLSKDDSGDIDMNQVEVRGCPAKIRFIKNTDKTTVKQAQKTQEQRVINTEQRFFNE